ncbi:MAG: hypothetical protein ABI624_17530, partial [Casimicrobiaceae bacterium]
GWGMQLVQGGNAIFATLYVYDAAGNPTFFTATLDASGAGWTGTLYRTTGPWFAGPTFNPAQVAAQAVGTLTFTPAASETGVLSYSVNGANVTRNVQRLLLRYDDYTGLYAITAQRLTTHCSDSAANVDVTVAETLAVAQTGTVWTADWTSAQRACHYSGNYNQAGRIGFASTAYTCTDGEEGNIAFFDLTRRNGFIAGRFQGHSIGNACDYRGQFAGIVPN